MTQRHVIAKTVFVNEKNEALVLRRSPWPEHPERSGRPDFPGGEIEAGETERHGAAREAFEEARITVDPLSLELLHTATTYLEQEDILAMRLLFMMKLDHTPEVVISAEHESYDWVPLADLPGDMNFSPFYSEALTQAHKYRLI